MARNETFIDAPPAQVFELLGDPRTYSDWVVGSREIRAADSEWPSAGSEFDHTVGPPALGIDDRTTVCASLPPVMLELRARARPLGSAQVSFYLQPEGEGTRVTMIEDPPSRALSALIGPLGHGLIKLRNVESLRRLKRIAEGETRPPSGELPPRGR